MARKPRSTSRNEMRIGQMANGTVSNTMNTTFSLSIVETVEQHETTSFGRPFFGMVELLDRSNKSARVAWYPTEEMLWDRTNSLSLTSITQVNGGLRALLRHLSGMVYGDANCIVVAPQEKLANRWASGTFAYVNQHYQGSFTGSDNVEYAMNVRPAPQGYWEKVILTQDGPRNSGEYIGANGEYKDQEHFWFLTTISAMYSQAAVSISLGPKTIVFGKEVCAIAALPYDERAAAVSAMYYAHRETHREAVKIEEAIGTDALRMQAGLPALKTDVSTVFDANDGGKYNLMFAPEKAVCYAGFKNFAFKYSPQTDAGRVERQAAAALMVARCVTKVDNRSNF